MASKISYKALFAIQEILKKTLKCLLIENRVNNII